MISFLPTRSCGGLSYCGIKDGRLIFELPIPLNSPAGTWKVNLRELASGKEASGMVSVK